MSFDGEKGELKFESTTGVPEIAGFYRTNLKKLGWQERPSVINGPGMVALDLSRGGKRLYVTIMQMGARTNVRAYGPGLVAAAAVAHRTRRPHAGRTATGAARPRPPAKGEQTLEAEDYKGFPVPESSDAKQYSRLQIPLRVERQGSAGLAAVLAHSTGESSPS